MQMRLTPVVIFLLAFLASCVTTMEPVGDPDASTLRLSITVGDTVRVLTKYGDRSTFKVLEITGKSLVGKREDIQFDDMAFVEKRVSTVSGKSAATVVLAIIGSCARRTKVASPPRRCPL